MSSTWIGDRVIESVLWQSFKQFDEEFSKLFETQAYSQEERLTGFFVEKLSQHGKMAQYSIMQINKSFKLPWYFSICYEDMTRTEKTYGADIAFIININIKDRMHSRKIILVQCKKMNTRSYPSPGITFLNSWPIDYNQARNLCQTTPYGFHFLYGPYSSAVCTRVAPSRSVMGLMRATRRKGTIPLYQTLLISRPFADFFLYDFIGCWAGDERDIAFKIVEGDLPEVMVRYLVHIDISHG
jgi:hypothetical protein